jgi:hypothetical protein
MRAVVAPDLNQHFEVLWLLVLLRVSHRHKEHLLWVFVPVSPDTKT